MGGKGSGAKPGQGKGRVSPRKGLPSGKPIPICGTVAKYNRHRKAGENCDLCRVANNLYYKKKYIKHPRKKADYSRRKPNLDAKKKIVREEKLRRQSCVHCGLLVTETNWMVFEFDHLEPSRKLFALSKAQAHKTTDIVDELKKCQLLCSNCHALHTYKERHFGYRKKIEDYKSTLQTQCEEDLFAHGLGA